MSPPRYQRSLVRVVMPVIVSRQFHILSDVLVAPILTVERVWRIFQMAGNEELTSLSGHDDADATLLAVGNELQFGVGQYVVAMQLRMAAMGHVEHIVEPPEDGQAVVERLLREDAKHLLRQRVFGHAVVVIESCLRRPTDI